VRNFRDEYLEHIRDKKCRAGKCKHLIRYEINPEKCMGCSICAKRCPAGCISQVTGGDKKRPPYQIDQSRCVKCGECFKNCKFSAITKA
jgi:ferredoxin